MNVLKSRQCFLVTESSSKTTKLESFKLETWVGAEVGKFGLESESKTKVDGPEVLTPICEPWKKIQKLRTELASILGKNPMKIQKIGFWELSQRHFWKKSSIFSLVPGKAFFG